MISLFNHQSEEAELKKQKKSGSVFWVIVQKEITDHITSWRYILLLFIICLTCLASLYTAVQAIQGISPSKLSVDTLFLKLFTTSDGTIPPYITFVSFLGPLLGIALGFDAVNSERNRGTLSRVMSQPVPRDYFINAKFVAALFVISVLFFTLGFLVMGIGILMIGIPPTLEEFWRILFFIILSVVYIAFWLNLSILFSIRFRQAATSALSGIAVWLFFTIFYSMIINLINKATMPNQNTATVHSVLSHANFMQALSRISPTQLFSDGTTTLLTPSVRTLGMVTQQQAYGAIPSPLSLGQSVLLVWPQITGLIALTLICFAISYVYFMRQEIRSRS